MLGTLSDLIVQAALGDSRVIILTGDHGYSLFDELRAKAPDQFINVGVAEQGMIGIASGLAKEGFRPIVYGLSSFVPIRCLEQIKLDICYFNLPVMILTTGAGLVYSKLGPSHQCAEDIACLMPLPNMRIYSPCDKWELKTSWRDAWEKENPSYLRIGQAYHPETHQGPIINWGTYVTNYGHYAKARIITHGAMVYSSTQIAKRLGLHCISVSQLKPLPDLTLLPGAKKTIVIEDHSKFGGLYSLIAATDWNAYSICLKDKFSEKCGDYQYAMSEHEMDDDALLTRIKKIIE